MSTITPGVSSWVSLGPEVLAPQRGTGTPPNHVAMVFVVLLGWGFLRISHSGSAAVITAVTVGAFGQLVRSAHWTQRQLSLGERIMVDPLRGLFPDQSVCVVHVRPSHVKMLVRSRPHSLRGGRNTEGWSRCFPKRCPMQARLHASRPCSPSGRGSTPISKRNEVGTWIP